MRLLLINPKIDFTSLNPKFDLFLKERIISRIEKHASLALLVVAGLTPPDVEVTYLDEHARDLNFDDPVDLVGIGCMTPQATRAYEIADAYRSRGVRVIMGGAHPTVLSEEVLDHADAVVVGEAERVWKTIIKDFKSGKLKKIYRGAPADMRRSPVPRYDLLTDADFEGVPCALVPIQCTRGCPRDCSYCSIPKLSGRKMRIKSKSQIQREAEAVAATVTCGCTDRLIRLVDANPFVNINFTKTICDAMAKINVKWTSLADVSIGHNPKILELLRGAGCFVVAIGFESIETDILDSMSPWKSGKRKLYEEAIRNINDHGIIVAGNFIIGYKRHTKDDLKRIIDFVSENKLASQCTIATPYPGTRFYEELRAAGRLKSEIDWRYYNAFNVVFEAEMDADEIAEDVCWLFEEMTAPSLMDEITRFNTQIVLGRT